MLQLIVHENAREVGILQPVACLIRKFGVPIAEHDSMDGEILDVEATIAERLERAAAAPESAGFGRLFDQLGYPNQKPAGRRLMELIAARGFRSHNHVVDACNLASVEFASGLGLHHAGAITHDIHVQRATGEESIRPLFKDEVEPVRAGDLIYTTGGAVIAWLGKRDVDSHAFRVTADTHHLLLMALGNAATTAEFNRQACMHAVRLIRRRSPEVFAQFIPVRVAGAGEHAQQAG